ncbi:MAG: Lrp/AsnC family transcriptional regulator [Victivallaceae bacterium]
MMDDIDIKIIEMLNEDGRLNNNEIARRLSVSEGTVRNRIKKLNDSSVLKVTGLINPDLMPEKQLFLLGVRIAASKDLTRTAEMISNLKGVLSVYITTGRYDLMVEVWLPVKHGLIDFIGGPMSTIDGVVSTESFLAMKSLKKWIAESE